MTISYSHFPKIAITSLKKNKIFKPFISFPISLSIGKHINHNNVFIYIDPSNKKHCTTERILQANEKNVLNKLAHNLL